MAASREHKKRLSILHRKPHRLYQRAISTIGNPPPGSVLPADGGTSRCHADQLSAILHGQQSYLSANGAGSSFQRLSQNDPPLVSAWLDPGAANRSYRRAGRPQKISSAASEALW